MTESIGYLSIVITAVAYVWYLWSIVHWKTKPHAFSRFIRAIMTGTAFFAQRTQTHDIATRVLGITSIITACIALYAWFRYRVVISKQDRLYFFLAVLWLIVWYVTKTPLWSVIIISITDMLAFIPTFRKVRYDPESESVWVYGLSAIKFALSLYSFGSFTLIVWLYPVYLVWANSVFVIYTLVRRWWVRKINY